MYQVGEYVVYGVQGVCKVLGKEKQMVNRKRTEYLVLEPLAKGASKFYLPTQNPSAMGKLCPLLSRQELTTLLESDEINRDCWVDEENLRKQQYRDLMAAADRLSLMQMLRGLYRYQAELMEVGKRIHLCDDNFLRDAERLLCSEIALVMEMSTDDAKQFLRGRLQ